MCFMLPPWYWNMRMNQEGALTPAVPVASAEHSHSQECLNATETAAESESHPIAGMTDWREKRQESSQL